MRFRSASLKLCGSLLALAIAGTPVWAAIRSPFGDHSLCCGPRGMVGIDGLPVRHTAQFALAAAPLAAASATPAVAQAAAPAAPTAAPAAKQAAAPTGPIEEVNGYLKIGFERLASFTFNPPPFDPAKPNEQPASAADQIPQSIKDLSGKNAVVTGFMLPVKNNGKGQITEFLLMRDAMMCCYGVVPNINEWVIVRMTNGGVQALQDIPLAVFGKLHVKEQYENGYLSGIYVLEAEKVSTSTPKG
jgi:hypothetical protein